MGLPEKNKFLPAGKHFAFEGLVSVSLILVFILVVVTGAMSFVRLNTVIRSVNNAIGQDKPLNEAKDIYDNLVKADNMVKSYILTRDEQDMALYNEMISSTWEKIRLLEKAAGNEELLRPVMDTLNILVEEKFNILDMYVIINGQYPDESAGRKAGETGMEAEAEEQALKAQELELTHRDKIIMEKLRQLIDNLEHRQVSRLEVHTGEAEKQASEVKRIIIFFGAASLLLLLLAGTNIYLYIRRNNEYRAILAKARNDAEALARDRQQFLANMSHEIKTPMNVIAGYLSQVLENPLPEPQREQLVIVKRSSDHLLELLNNLLDMSKLQADKLDLMESDFSPAEILSDMKSWFIPSAEEKNLQLAVHIGPDVPEFVRGDAVRIRQILFNLAGNAVKFTEKGTITFSLYKGEEQGDRTVLAFEVSDTGIGIPPEDLEKIFVEFGQVAGGSFLKSKGTGLGIPISSRLVKLMGGELKVESTPGKGSVFTVEIPLKPVQVIAQKSHPRPAMAKDILNGLRVLIVDDEEYNRGLLKLILGKYGCILSEAGGGAEAVNLAREQIPDLVLMDIRMPDMNGMDATAAIRLQAAHGGPRIPVIAVSAAMSPEDIAEYRKSGMNDFISKPFEEEKLIKAILRQIEESGIRTTAVPRSEAGYSLDALREGSGGNTGFVREMVHLFLRNTESGLTELQGMLDSGSGQRLGDLIHKINGPIRHLRADFLYSALRELQREHDGGNLPGAVSALARARAEFERIRTDLLAQPEFISE